MDFTLLPIVTEVKLLQLSNALGPIEVTLLGMTTEGNSRQSEKQCMGISVILLPIVTEVSFEQTEKALGPIAVTLLGIFMDVIRKKKRKQND